MKKPHALAMVLAAVLILGLILLMLPEPEPAAEPLVESFPTMGTYLTITVHPASEKNRQAMVEAAAEVERLNATYSFHNPASLVSRINRAGPAGCEVDTEFLMILDRCREMNALTAGAFDPTVGPLMKLWGFQRKQGRVPTDAEIRSALAKVGFSKVRIEGTRVSLARPGMALDFGASVKGYAVDRASAILKARGCADFMMDLGGNIYAAGKSPSGGPWRIGLRDPRDTGSVNAVIRLSDAGVATSGDYERMFVRDGRRYAHIVNPATGYPVASMACVTVIARDAFTADLFSTSCFLVGPSHPLPDSRVIGALYGACRDSAGQAIEYSLTRGFQSALVEENLGRTESLPW